MSAAVPLVQGAYVSAAPMPTQQMQVTIPDGVGPGTCFQVNTPAGPMQTVCPAGCKAGSEIVIDVPMSMEVVPMGIAVVAPVPMAAAVAPMPMQMQTEHGHLEDGYYILSTCPGCHEGQVTFSPDKQSLTIGPVRCWQCCICPSETMYNQPPGSLTYASGGGTFPSGVIFTSSDTFTNPKNGQSYQKKR